MPLKIYLLKLKEDRPQWTNQRKVEHLFVKHSGIRISLNEAIKTIHLVSMGNEAEVAFNTTKIETIEADFLKHSILVIPK